jgi:hypothetical protein
VNLAGVRILFELEERLGTRILEALYAEGTGNGSKSRARSRGTEPERGEHDTDDKVDEALAPDPNPDRRT